MEFSQSAGYSGGYTDVFFLHFKTSVPNKVATISKQLNLYLIQTNSGLLLSGFS